MWRVGVKTIPVDEDPQDITQSLSHLSLTADEVGIPKDFTFSKSSNQKL
jgi:hypothetical protein